MADALMRTLLQRGHDRSMSKSINTKSATTPRGETTKGGAVEPPGELMNAVVQTRYGPPARVLKRAKITIPTIGSHDGLPRRSCQGSRHCS